MDILRRMFPRPNASGANVVIADLPGSSFQAIQRKRAETRCELKAHVYRYADKRFIVSSVRWVPGSAIVETGQPTVLPIDVSDDELGRAVCEHLLQHQAQEPTDLRDRKLKDWAAYQASGARSVTSFESHSWRVMVETINLVLALEAAPMKSLHGEICIKGISQPVHAELGSTIRRTLSAAEVVRQAGLI